MRLIMLIVIMMVTIAIMIKILPIESAAMDSVMKPPAYCFRVYSIQSWEFLSDPTDYLTVTRSHETVDLCPTWM